MSVMFACTATLQLVMEYDQVNLLILLCRAVWVGGKRG